MTAPIFAARGPAGIRRLERLERWFVVLVATHSYAIGAMLVFTTDFSVRFGGWGDVGDLFFVHQGGVFHLAMASGYLYEHLRYRGLGLMILAKSIATVFLTVEAVAGGAWSVGLSAAADAGMLMAAVWLAWRKASARPSGQR